MKVQNTQPSFGRIVRDSSLSEEMYKALMDTQVVREFAKKYNAKMEIESFLSTKTPHKPQWGLRFTDITPKNIFTRIANVINQKITNKTILLKTHSDNEEGLLKSLSNIKSNSLIKIYKDIN